MDGRKEDRRGLGEGEEIEKTKGERKKKMRETKEAGRNPPPLTLLIV